MNLTTPRLWCASPDLLPGSVQLDWRRNDIPDQLTLDAAEAANVMDRFRAAPNERGCYLALQSAIAARGTA